MNDDQKREEMNLRRTVAGSATACSVMDALAPLEPLAVVAIITWADGSVTVNAAQSNHPASLLGALRAAKLWGPEWATRTAKEMGIPSEALLTAATPTPSEGGN